MRTGGCMGEIVGMAASLCKVHDASPRAVYESHLDELKAIMARGVGKHPGVNPGYENDAEGKVPVAKPRPAATPALPAQVLPAS